MSTPPPPRLPLMCTKHALRAVVAVLSLGIDTIISFAEEVKTLATEPPENKNSAARSSYYYKLVRRTSKQKRDRWEYHPLSFDDTDLVP